jgi:hypothetical protein
MSLIIRNNMEDKTTHQETTIPPELRNPTGKGGFGDHPEHQSPGGWNPDLTFSYQYKRFLKMSMGEYNSWGKNVKDNNDITNVEIIAYAAVAKARTDIKERQELANRTEGMPKQSVAVEGVDPKMEEEVSELKKIIIKYSNDRRPKENSEGLTPPVQTG